MFEQGLKRIDDILRKEAGCTKNIDATTFDLSAKNPHGGEEVTHRSPLEIMNEIAALDTESAKVLARIKELL